MQRMEQALAKVLAGGPEQVIFCEHEPVITLGSSGKPEDASQITDIPVISTGRGGKATYHGPGQRVVYPIVKLDHWNRDVRAYVKWLQNWLITSLSELGVKAHTTDDIGVWVGEEKIAAIGIRVRKGVAYHGVALNVSNDLAIYQRFIPCGMTDKGVTSLQKLGLEITLQDIDIVMKKQWSRLLPTPKS
jgi:lipoyl(octanoyl) transferase